jgi:hypothetical protein
LPGIFKIKSLWLGLFLAFPPVAAWTLRGNAESLNPPPAAHSAPAPAAVPAEENLMQVPVEVVANGGKTEWVVVEVTNQAIPEPGAAAMLALSSLLLLRRQRRK